MLEKRNDGSYEIDLFAIFKALWNRVWIILLVAVVFGVGGFAYAKTQIAPTYSANTMLYVNTSSTLSLSSYKVSSADLNTASSLVSRYLVILKSKTCLNGIIAEAGISGKYTVSQLSGMISARAVDETEIINVTVTCHDAQEAADIANAIAVVLPQNINSIIEGTDARVIDRAEVNNNQVAPSYTRYAIIGGVIGLIAAVAVIVILELMDDLIHDDEYVIQTYSDIPLLAAIPDLTLHADKYNYRYGTKDRQMGVYKMSKEMMEEENDEEAENNG